MKILYIVTSLDDKAPVNFAKKLAEYEMANGNEVVLGYFDEIHKISVSFPIIHLNMNENIDFDKYDIIHTHMYRPDKYVAKYSRYIKKAKTVSTMHCFIKEDLRYAYGSIISTFFTPVWISYLRKMDAVVEISDYIYHEHCKYFENNYKIYNGVELYCGVESQHNDIVNRINEYKNRKLKVILSYSSIIKRKGLEQIINLLANDQSYSYICIGNGEEREKLINKVEKFKIADRIAFFDFIAKPYELLDYADIFVIPSYSEGFSLALLEAGMKKASIVCSDIPSFNMQFSDKEVTFFELDNTDSLNRALDIAYEEKVQKGKNIYEKIARDYSFSMMCKKYDDMYGALIELNKN